LPSEPLGYDADMDPFPALFAQLSDLSGWEFSVVITMVTAPGWITAAWFAWIFKRGRAAVWEWTAFAIVAALSCTWFAWLLSQIPG
jgi:hypothetical protein